MKDQLENNPNIINTTLRNSSSILINATSDHRRPPRNAGLLRQGALVTKKLELLTGPSMQLRPLPHYGGLWCIHVTPMCSTLVPQL